MGGINCLAHVRACILIKHGKSATVREHVHLGGESAGLARAAEGSKPLVADACDLEYVGGYAHAMAFEQLQCDAARSAKRCRETS